MKSKRINNFCLGKNASIKNHKRRTCRACKAWYAKKWRSTEKGAKYTKEWNNKIKHTPMYNAKKEIHILVKNLRIVPARLKRCVDCGKKANVYDHRDYSKPKKVEPVCYACNKRRGPAKCGT